MRKIIVDISLRPRPTLKTPLKGSEGDCTDETMAKYTDLSSIVQRYAGNLAELAAWRGTMSFGEQPVNNLEDAIDKLKEAHDYIAESPYESLEDAIEAINNGLFGKESEPVEPPKNEPAEPPKKEMKNEKVENNPPPVKENLSKNSQQAAS